MCVLKCLEPSTLGRPDSAMELPGSSQDAKYVEEVEADDSLGVHIVPEGVEANQRCDK